MAVLSELGVREASEAIRTGELTAEALAEALLARCAAAASFNAFISVEPDPDNVASRPRGRHCFTLCCGRADGVDDQVRAGAAGEGGDAARKGSLPRIPG